MPWSALALTLAFLTSGPDSAAPDVFVPAPTVQVQHLQAHYAKVVAELRSTDVTGLTPDRAAERARLIGVLQRFGERGEFGRNVDFPSARVPYFRDAKGLRCAVAELMHASGEDEFVEAVRRERNHVWICDLKGDPTFEAWLDRSGFTIEEAGRIHGPPVVEGPVSGGSSGGGGSTPAPAGGSYTGPGDTAPGGGSGGATSGGSTPSGGSSGPSTSGSGQRSSGGGGGSSGGPGGAGGGMPGVPRPITLTTTSDDTWWLWWEYNKGEWLRPNRLSINNSPVTGDDAEAALRNAIARSRDTVQPLFLAAAEDPDANVRATAALALGRVAGAKAVPVLQRMLEDANVDVRHRAILGLGAAGSDDAIRALLSIARFGALTEDARARISSQARPLAIVALGLARHFTFDDRLDVEIVKLLQTRAKSERESIGVAGLIYQMLSPNAELETYAMAMAADDSESPSVRCRAVESLRSGFDPKTLSALQTHLSGPRLDLRRSAALALGEVHSTLALPALMTAFELESESLTRGFILVSIGKQGGPKAQQYLLDVAEKGEGGMRRWAVLGLGILANTTTDAEARTRIASAIRAAGAREKNSDSFGAYWVASGLAHDQEAMSAIRTGLIDCANSRQRMYAATGLALLGGDASLELLRTRIREESQALVRVEIAHALGILGRSGDVGLMVEMLTRLREPQLQGMAASSMAAHGSAEALMSLMEIARAEDGSNVRRAAAIDGLGMILAPHPALAFTSVSRASNYTVFADWVGGIYQTTL